MIGTLFRIAIRFGLFGFVVNYIRNRRGVSRVMRSR